MNTRRSISPLRYAGGKSWFIPYIDALLARTPRPRLFVEPFAGGAHVGLHVAYTNRADHVRLNELDPDVASLWHTLINSERINLHWLITRVRSTQSITDVYHEAQIHRTRSQRDRAWAFLVRNRVGYGGKSASAGIMTDKDARWYPQTLAQRMVKIAHLAHIDQRLSFTQRDAFDVIAETMHDPDHFLFIDPPYPLRGTPLYSFDTIDHEALFDLLAQAKARFVMTYNDVPQIRELIERYGFRSMPVTVFTNAKTRKRELIITGAK
jgi:DNA adenine methylase